MHSAKVIARQVAEDAHPTVARHILVLNADRREIGRVLVNDGSERDHDGGQ
jgi:hypothetical protein